MVIGGSASRKRKTPAKPALTPNPSRKSARVSLQDAVSESKEEIGSAEEVSQDDLVVEITPMGTRAIINETILDKEFLDEHQLEEVVDLLKAQGWENMFRDEVVVDEELIKEFYQSLVVEERGKLTICTFTVNGVTEAVSSRDLAAILVVPSNGYEEYVKTVWPSEIPKAEVIKRVGEDPSNDSNQGDALKFGIVKRTLHRLVCTSIIPRRQRYGKISFLDFLLLDKIIRREQVNLPKLILRHMLYCKSNLVHGLPYPGIVKKILLAMDMYKPVNEKVVSSLLNMEAYSKLSWKYDDSEGWVYERGQGDVPVKDDEEEPQAGVEGGKVKIEANSVQELLLQVIQKMESIEKLLSSALSRDSSDRVNLTAATEKNTSVLSAVLKSVEIERVKKAAAARGQGMEIVPAGPVVNVPVEVQKPPANE